MANSTKKTQRDFYNEILNGYALTDEQKEFIKGRIAQLDKKSTSSKGKETATQKANAELKDKILAEMESDKAYTISDMLKNLECFGFFRAFFRVIFGYFHRAASSPG